jgi:hypothetical protein
VKSKQHEFFSVPSSGILGKLRRKGPVNAAGNRNDGKIKSMRLTLCVYQNNKQKEEVIRRV